MMIMVNSTPNINLKVSSNVFNAKVLISSSEIVSLMTFPFVLWLAFVTVWVKFPLFEQSPLFPIETRRIDDVYDLFSLMQNTSWLNFE